MSYCRFENTVGDLRDCIAHVGDKLSGEYEIDARRRLIDAAIELLENVGLEVVVFDDEKANVDREIERFVKEAQSDGFDEDKDESEAEEQS